MNQNPALLALGILFYRWHNVQAFIVQAQHPDWADEDVFQVIRFPMRIELLERVESI